MRLGKRLPHGHVASSLVHHHAWHRVHPGRNGPYLSHAEPKPIPPATVGFGDWIGTRNPWWRQIIWAVVLVAIFHVVLTRTRWGLHTIATGGNQLGAREAGINVGRIKYGNFMITGLLGALVGLQTAFYINNIDPLAGGYSRCSTA